MCNGIQAQSDLKQCEIRHFPTISITIVHVMYMTVQCYLPQGNTSISGHFVGGDTRYGHETLYRPRVCHSMFNHTFPCQPLSQCTVVADFFSTILGRVTRARLDAFTNGIWSCNFVRTRVTPYWDCLVFCSPLLFLWNPNLSNTPVRARRKTGFVFAKISFSVHR